MNNLNALLQFVSGKKTYLTSLATGVLLFGDWQHWWQIPDQVYLAMMAAAVAFLRAGIAKGPDDPTIDPPAAPAGGTGSSIAKIPLMLAFASLALLIIGCNTTSQQVAYQGAGTAVVSVDTAMNLWGAYVQAEHPSTNVELEVKAAYEKYQASMAVACDAGAAYAASSVTNNVASGSTNALQNSAALLALQNAAQNASQDLSDLENLITSFGVKLQ